MRVRTLAAAFAVTGVLSGGTALADGDAANGETLFKRCTACHNFDPGKKKIGPHLKGIVGRRAGSVEGYKYSKAMAAADITWDEASLDEFIAQPRAFVKGTKMGFAGLRDDAQRQDIIAYLKAAAD